MPSHFLSPSPSLSLSLLSSLMHTLFLSLSLPFSLTNEYRVDRDCCHSYLKTVIDEMVSLKCITHKLVKSISQQGMSISTVTSLWVKLL